MVIIDFFKKLFGIYVDKFIHIYFYEWSDLHLLPLEFYSINDFINFLDASNIIYSEGLIDVLRCGGEYHGCCYDGNNVLLLSDDINDLYTKMLS